MKTTVQNLMNATLTLAVIVNEKRRLSSKGQYRVARLHSKLLPEFKVIDARRDEMIRAYNNPQTKTVTLPETGATAEVPVEGQWQVPADKMPEFTAAWKIIGDEEIEIDAQPIPLSYLDFGEGVEGSIAADEFIALGDFVTED